MYRWHKELPLLEARLKMDLASHRGHDCDCELGMFRKVRPLSCPAFCKYYKKGNGKEKRRFNYRRKLLFAALDEKEERA